MQLKRNLASWIKRRKIRSSSPILHSGALFQNAWVTQEDDLGLHAMIGTNALPGSGSLPRLIEFPHGIGTDQEYGASEGGMCTSPLTPFSEGRRNLVGKGRVHSKFRSVTVRSWLLARGIRFLSGHLAKCGDMVVQILERSVFEGFDQGSLKEAEPQAGISEQYPELVRL